MKKSLAEILSEPANVEEIIQKANEINERLKEVENMPELEVSSFNDTENDVYGLDVDCFGNCFSDADPGL